MKVKQMTHVVIKGDFGGIFLFLKIETTAPVNPMLLINK